MKLQIIYGYTDNIQTEKLKIVTTSNRHSITFHKSLAFSLPNHVFLLPNIFFCGYGHVILYGILSEKYVDPNVILNLSVVQSCASATYYLVDLHYEKLDCYKLSQQKYFPSRVDMLSSRQTGYDGVGEPNVCPGIKRR